MDKRIVKQIIYGVGYLAIFFLIVFSIYFIWLRPAPTCSDNRQNQAETGVDCGGPCLACEIQTLTPLTVSWTKVFSGDGQTIVAAEIKNFNLNYGAEAFNYNLEIYGKDNINLKTLAENSFIYSGEIKYFVEPVEVDAKEISDVKISFSNLNWKSKEEFPKPEIQIRDTKTELDSADSRVVVSGFIKNNNAFALSKARIFGFLLNQQNSYINASKTELENLAAFEERPFKINFPKNISLITNTQSTPYNFSRNLTIGSTGDDVKKLQQFLKDQGFYNNEISGKFDSNTKNSLIQFQKKVNISPASGSFGPTTRNFINSLKSTPSSSQADASKTKIYVETIK